MLLPALVIAALILHFFLDAERGRVRRESMDVARALVAVLDREVLGQIRAIQVLAEAPSIRRGDLVSFDRQARAVSSLIGGSIVLRDLQGRALTNSRRPPGEPGEALVNDPESDAVLLATRQPTVSDLILSPLSGRPILLVRAPVIQDGQVTHLLGLAMQVDQLNALIAGMGLPPGWSASIVDRKGTEATRLGQAALPPEEALAMAESGEVRLTRDGHGVPVLVAQSRSAVLGWRVRLLVPTRLAEAPLQHSLLLLGAGALVLALLTILLAWTAARRIAAPMRILAQSATRLGQGKAVALPASGVREIDAVGAVLTRTGEALRARSRALAERETQFARAIDAGRIGSWEWDVEADRLTGSPGREALYGLAPGEVGSSAAIISAVMPADRPLIAAALEAALRRDGPGAYAVEFRTRWPNGEIRWLRSQGGVTDRAPDGTARRMAGVIIDISEIRRATERERLLISEVDHRARNVLAVVQSVVRLSRSDDPRHFADAVEGRVAALARAHTLLARERWEGGELREVLREELAAYGSERLLLEGEDLQLAPVAVQPLAMVVHELATNAAKHGALSQPEGRVELRWSVTGDVLLLAWQERGGPRVEAPTRRGFGSKLIDTTVRVQLGGSVEKQWEEGGLLCRISLPAARSLRSDTPSTPIAPLGEPLQIRPAKTAALLEERRILLVEDEPLVALEIEAALQALGCVVIGPVASLGEAMQLARAELDLLDAAVLDINLAGQASFPVADLLLGQGVPVVFATGYGELLPRHATERTELLRKPLAKGALAEALARLLLRHGGRLGRAATRAAG
jgi:PAS domain S-box-containing protein